MHGPVGEGGALLVDIAREVGHGQHVAGEVDIGAAGIAHDADLVLVQERRVGDALGDRAGVGVLGDPLGADDGEGAAEQRLGGIGGAGSLEVALDAAVVLGGASARGAPAVGDQEGVGAAALIFWVKLWLAQVET